MQNFTQDRLIQSENLTEFNIAYPIYITGWEVRQVQDINKLYARVFYKKSVRDAKAAKIKLTCISEFGEIIQEEIKSINDIDKKAYDFFEIYPLHNDTRKIQVSVIQGLSSDGTITAETQAIMVSNTFVPFGQEIESAAGQRLVASAKGYPIKTENCWICCCGALNANSSEKCVVCESAKADVFEKITEENIKEQAATVADERKAKKEQEEKEQANQRIQRKKRNKLIAILSACCAMAIILFCSLYFPLAPLKNVTQGDIEFTKVGNSYIVTAYTGNDTNVIIPNEVKGIDVIEIGSEAFYNCGSLTNIAIPSSIRKIGDSAFEDCTGLTEITIPESVEEIGNSAFEGCTNLTQINYNAVAIKDYTSAPNIFCNAGINGDGILVVFGESVINIPAYIFNITIAKDRLPPNISNVIIGSNIEEIGDGTFFNCTGLTNITLANVKRIGVLAFGNCTELTEITIPDNVEEIGRSAFEDCTGLTNVIIGNKINRIEDSVFEGCIGLEEITIPESVEEIGDGAFRNCTGLTNIAFWNKIKRIGVWAFENCTNLKAITFPASIEEIDGAAFRNCIGLTKITLRNGIKNISYSAFEGCAGLKEITFPESVEEIEESAFAGCINLASVIFENPNGWSYSRSHGTSGTPISGTSLSSPSTAATYLTSTYVSYYWKRS